MTMQNHSFDWVKTLSDYGFSDIEQFDYTPRESGYTNFYTAIYKDEKVFVKCGRGNFYAEREHCINNTLYTFSSEHFVKSVMFQNIDKKMFVATKYYKSLTLDKCFIKTMNDEKINKIFDSIIEIGLILNKNKFIFRDFNEKNLLVEDDGNVRLFDPQHLVGEQYPENKHNLKNLKKLRGTNKKLRPYPYVWDDMYAIYKMLKKFPKSKIKNYDEKLKTVKNLINTNRYYLFDNEIPAESYKNMKIAVLYKILNEIFKPFRRFL